MSGKRSPSFPLPGAKKKFPGPVVGSVGSAREPTAWGRVPHHLWVIVFKFLDHYDLMKIIQISQKLGIEPWVSAASSKSLWKDVTWTVPEKVQEQKPIPILEIAKDEFLGPHTTSLIVIGAELTEERWYSHVGLVCCNIKRLHYIDCTVTFHLYLVSLLPKAIEEFILDDISISNFEDGSKKSDLTVDEVEIILRKGLDKRRKGWPYLTRTELTMKSPNANKGPTLVVGDDGCVERFSPILE